MQNPEYRKKKAKYNREYQRKYRPKYRTKPEVQAKMREYQRNRNKKQNQERRRIQESTLGKHCALCDSVPNDKVDKGGRLQHYLEYHEIYGKKHPLTLKYFLEHKDDFVPLCKLCHKVVHHLMKVFGLTWKDMLALKETRRTA
jgi:hypothetical protein